MPEISGSVDILRPIEEVFAYLSEPANSIQWESGVVVNELTSEGPLAVGSKGRRVEKQMGTDEGVWEITEHVENATLSMKFESGRFTGSGGYKLEPTGGGTRVNYWFSGDPKQIIFKLLIPLMTPMIRRQVRKNFAKLKAIVESGG